jgi:hypothetical protein
MPEQQQTAPALPEGIKPAPRPATGTATVTVACKVPNGLILRTWKMEDTTEPLFGGGERTIKNGKAFQVGEDVVIHGSALNPLTLRAGELPEYPHVGGFALTHGVPADFWELWREQHADHPAVKNGLIFAYASQDAAAGAARDRKDLVSGFEGIDPDDPAKRTGIRAVTKGDRPAR